MDLLLTTQTENNAIQFITKSATSVPLFPPFSPQAIWSIQDSQHTANCEPRTGVGKLQVRWCYFKATKSFRIWRQSFNSSEPQCPTLPTTPNKMEGILWFSLRVTEINRHTQDCKCCTNIGDAGSIEEVGTFLPRWVFPTWCELHC